MMTLWMMRRYVVDIKLFMRSGMLILEFCLEMRCLFVYQYFEQYETAFMQLAKLFSKAALEVYEGQQWDVDYDSGWRDDPEYPK
jgi:hypothetical protein